MDVEETLLEIRSIGHPFPDLLGIKKFIKTLFRYTRNLVKHVEFYKILEKDINHY